MTTALTVFSASDRAQLAQAQAIRDSVFCREQGVSPALEWDGRDALCAHYLLVGDGLAIATARTRLYDPDTFKIERVAVLREHRGTGAGREIMRYVLSVLAPLRLARPRRIVLNAQTTVAGFYASLGFSITGPGFEEANIPHVPMALS